MRSHRDSLDLNCIIGPSGVLTNRSSVGYGLPEKMVPAVIILDGSIRMS